MESNTLFSWKVQLRILTYSFLVMGTVMYVWTFLTAYLSPFKYVRVNINNYLEAGAELYMIIVFSIISIAYFIIWLGDIYKK